MDARTRKLAIKLGDRDLAAKLVEAGLDSPAKIKRAKNKEIVAVKGIGQAALERVRATFAQL